MLAEQKLAKEKEAYDKRFIFSNGNKQMKYGEEKIIIWISSCFFIDLATLEIFDI
jgi:hypothetical protein